ncbi:hypothetical protein ACFRAQ_34775 [Nocardia sp. NPDC056611]|uniref:hypothetical protein n=1 Tax=Nocardia sp. NPDC056611 TaxID=3345877 RepID=UPI00366E73CB
MRDIPLHELVSPDGHLARSVFFDENPGAEVLRPLLMFFVEHSDEVRKGLWLRLEEAQAAAKKTADTAAEVDPKGEIRFWREVDQSQSAAIARVEKARADLDLIETDPNETEE